MPSLLSGLELPLPALLKKAAVRRGEDMPLAETGDALQGDGFRRTRHPYESIKLVTPIFTEALQRQIDDEIVRYEAVSGHRIPPAYRFPKVDAPETWGTNKTARLEPILWVSRQLESPKSRQDSINQLACVIERVERIVRHRFQEVSHLYLPDPLPIRLPEPLPETVRTPQGKRRVLVSYATRHVTIFREDGAVQVQATPQLEKLNYLERAKNPDWVLLTKPGLSALAFWDS